MAHRLIWSPAARLDLADLYHYIAEANPSAAGQFVRGVFHVIERLVDFPESGRVVPELGDPEIREVIKKPCRIAYRLQRERQEVEIVRVWHAARGLPEI